MADQNNPEVSPEASLMAIPNYCPRDGSELEDGVRFGYPALVCPMCTYWKIKPT